MALTSYINSSFLGTFINPKFVGLIYTITSLIAILALLEMPKILKRFGNYHTISFFLFINIISLFLLSTLNNKTFIILIFIIYLSTINLIIASIDIFVEDFSAKKATGNIRGIFLTVLNSAWVIAQLAMGFFASKISYNGLYAISFFFVIAVLLIIRFKLKKFEDPIYKKIPVKETILKILQNKHISKIYASNFLLQFFYVWMVIYTPIYLNQNMGFGWSKIGIIFTIMLLPFVILQLPLGRLSDKIGEKKLLKLGFIIIIIATVSLAFINSKSILIWGIILFATRVGASIIEVMNESYFFKQITARDADIISFFRNASPTAYIIAPLIATPFLIFFPFNSIFIFLGLIMTLGLYSSFTLKDTK
jgi:MFS family permease